MEPVNQSNNNENHETHDSKKPPLRPGLDLIRLIEGWLLIALAVVLASFATDKISFDSIGTLVLVVIVLSLLNMILKPILILFTLPFILVTLGLGVWLINAGLLMLAAKIVNGFEVESFGAALWGSFVISLISILANKFIIRRYPLGSLFGKVIGGRKQYRHKKSDDVIDV